MIKSEYLLTLLLTFVVGYLLYLTMAPFFIPIFWAVVFAILFYPYYLWLQRHVTKRRHLASFIACLTVAVFLIAPMAIIGALLAQEIYDLFLWSEAYMSGVSTKAHKSPLFLFKSMERLLSPYIDVTAADIQNFFARAVKQAAAFAGTGLKDFIRNFAELVFNITLAFFSMYFLFVDGERLLGFVKNLLPLSEHDKERILRKNTAVIRATIYGGVAVGAAQGVLGGLAFWVLGLKAPVLWGFVMFMLSFLPGIGTALVWGPAAIYLLIIGSVYKGAVMILWGALVVGLADNLLRPVIVSGKTNLHPLLLFFSILGAVNAFGLIGVIAGPLILSIGLVAVEIYLETLRRKSSWEG